MKIYNTLTRQKEELVPHGTGRGCVSMPAAPRCTTTSISATPGPCACFDVLRRYLEWRGWQVHFVQNFTDIDDKIIRRAKEENTTVTDRSPKDISTNSGSTPRA